MKNHNEPAALRILHDRWEELIRLAKSALRSKRAKSSKRHVLRVFEPRRTRAVAAIRRQRSPIVVRRRVPRGEAGKASPARPRTL